MRISSLFCLFPALLVPATLLQAQAPSQAATPPTASSLVSPALDTLRHALVGLRLDKWKAPGPVRQEADSNIGSITRDLDGTLPGLLSKADAAPGLISQNLPVFRNVDALYDVLLRVVETADLSAPEAETDTLHHALSTLEDARRSLGDALQDAAQTQEKQVATLTEQVRAQVAAPRPPVSTTTVNDSSKPAVPVHRHKPAPKPATPPTQAPQQ